MTIKRFIVSVVAAIFFILSACSNGDTPESAQSTTTTASTTDTGLLESTTPSETTTTEAPADASEPTPETDETLRIVSLSPSATELLFAIGAGSNVVAVDEYSYYPPEAPVTELSGWDPNVEAVLSYLPDLVVIANDSNNLVDSLTQVGVDVLINAAPADIESGYDALIKLGQAVGRANEAMEFAETFKADIEAALSRSPQLPMRVYHELDGNHYSASSMSFIGDVYAALGTTNIADPADADGYGYPQLTEEYIIEADPELIVITDRVSYDAEDVSTRPGWENITAVLNGHITVVDADIASRWGPRLPRFIETIVDALRDIRDAVSDAP